MFLKMLSQDPGQAAPPKKSSLKPTGAAQAKENTQPRFFGQGEAGAIPAALHPRDWNIKGSLGSRNLGLYSSKPLAGPHLKHFQLGQRKSSGLEFC